MKIVGMIPARLGSKRIKNKNLRLINGKPLVQYIIESAVKSKKLKDIYMNSEGTIFKEIADECGIHFYHRPEELALDKATNDDFALDFINAIDCDILVQLLPTSPFISPEEIADFVQKMMDENYDTLISVTNVQIESIYKGEPINFDQKKKTSPSQLLEPVQAYACGLMGWRCENFRENIRKYGAAYHGGDGKIGFFPLKGFSTVDIDNEEDFVLAGVVAEALSKPKSEPAYYNSEREKLIFDADRERILINDGVCKNRMHDYNHEVVNVRDIIDQNATDKSWSYTVVNSPSNSATLIAQMPGEGNRMHFHHDWDEWWYIIEGEWQWLIDGVSKTVEKGDLVFIERGRKHKITAKGNKLAIRLAVSRNDVDHVYEKINYHTSKGD